MTEQGQTWEELFDELFTVEPTADGEAWRLLCRRSPIQGTQLAVTCHQDTAESIKREVRQAVERIVAQAIKLRQGELTW